MTVENFIGYSPMSSNSMIMDDEDRYLCSIVGTTLNYEEMQQYLESQSNLDLMRVMDGSGYTLLHLAAYRNSFKFAKLICEHVKQIWFNNVSSLGPIRVSY